MKGDKYLFPELSDRSPKPNTSRETIRNQNRIFGVKRSVVNFFVIGIVLILLLFTLNPFYRSLSTGPSGTLRLISIDHVEIIGEVAQNSIVINLTINAAKSAKITTSSIDLGYNGSTNMVISNNGTLSSGDNFVKLILYSDSITPFKQGDYLVNLIWHFLDRGDNEILSIQFLAP